jgi:hypothetical protein
VFEGTKWRCPECGALWKWKPHNPNESGWFHNSDPSIWVPLHTRKDVRFVFWLSFISLALWIAASVA